MSTSAILLMAGNGSRFDPKTPKQFYRLSGKRIYLYTLEALIASNLFAEIILVVHPDWISLVHKETLHCGPSLRIIPGGKTRQASSLLGVQACTHRYVLIHDAVRPFVSQKILEENLRLCEKNEAVDTCIPSYDTLVHSQNGKIIDAIPDRKQFLRGQTPQTFSLSLIKKAHEAALSHDLTDASDDCSLVSRLNIPIAVAEGSDENIKITTELDVYLAEQILRLPKEFASKQKISLQGKKFILTGGTGIIGRAIAKILQEKGAETILISRSSEEYPADLTDTKANKAIFHKIFQTIGLVDGLINCIGILDKKNLETQTSEEIENTIATNLTSIIFACKNAQLKPGSHILNIASSSYSRGRKEMAAYSSTKAALVNFTQGLAEERSDIFVNAMAPKRTQSLMREKNFQENSQELLDPSVIAAKALELLSSEGITGSILSIF